MGLALGRDLSGGGLGLGREFVERRVLIGVVLVGEDAVDGGRVLLVELSDFHQVLLVQVFGGRDVFVVLGVPAVGLLLLALP